MSINEFRKQIRDWAEINLINKTVYNKSLGKYIIFNRRGIKHAISYSKDNYVQKLKSFYSLEEIVKKAIYDKIEDDNKNRDNIVAIIKLKSELEVENEMYKIDVIIRHTNEGRFYYDHILIKKH